MASPAEDGTEDIYAILGLPSGPDSTDAEIRKAYRKRALESHPDKRPGEKNAAEEFDRIQKAYEVLSDKAARQAYDDLQRVQQERAERVTQLSAKRQKMVADLVAREKAAEREKNEEEVARAKLKAELERIRRQSAEAKRAKQQGAGPWGASVPGFGAQGSGQCSGLSAGGRDGVQGGPNAGMDEEEMARTLKISWAKSEDGGGGYAAQRLREIFGEFGAVEDVLVRAGKKKKGSALVVMASSAAAVSATQSVCGDISNPLLVVPAAPLTRADGATAATQIPTPSPPSPPDTAGSASAGATGGGAFRAGGPGGPGDPLGTASRMAGRSGTGSERGLGGGLGFGLGGAAGVRVPSGSGPCPGGQPGGGGGEAWGGFRAPSSGVANGVPAGGATVGSAYRDYENLTLMRMRQAGERARLIREMQAQEEKERADGK